MNKISVVIPCYNEEEMLNMCYQKIKLVMSNIDNVDYEIILGDDGSRDNTLSIMRELASKDDNVKYLSLSRNFGKEAVMYALFKKATGDYVVVLDCDLQDPPELIVEMYNEIIKGEYDCIATRRKNRKGEPIIRSLFSRMFYKVINKMSKLNIVDGARDFRMMNRKMLDSILQISEYSRFSKGIFQWVGYKTKWLEFENIERAKGQTKWSFSKLLLYALEGIISFSTAPLHIATTIGILLFFVTIIIGIVMLLKVFMYGQVLATLLIIIPIITFISSMQFLCIGILGEYISKIYLESKDRPVYIIKEEN